MVLEDPLHRFEQVRLQRQRVVQSRLSLLEEVNQSLVLHAVPQDGDGAAENQEGDAGVSVSNLEVLGRKQRHPVVDFKIAASFILPPAPELPVNYSGPVQLGWFSWVSPHTEL